MFFNATNNHSMETFSCKQLLHTSKKTIELSVAAKVAPQGHRLLINCLILLLVNKVSIANNCQENPRKILLARTT